MDRLIAIAKRGVIAAHDCLAVLVCATLLSCAFAPQAHAYVDPSIMTYTIQALAGVAVALSAVAGVAFRRSRKAIMRVLNIDENANKRVDPTIYRRDSNGKPIRDASPRGASRDRRPTRDRRPSPNRNRTRREPAAQAPLGWTDRLWRAGLAALFLVGTVFLVAPAEMVAANTEDLIFTLADVWWVLLLRTVIATAILALLVSLLKGKAFDFALLLIVAIGLCFYLQALFMNQSLPSADGATFELSEHIPITLISCIVWIAILFGAFKLFTLNSQVGRNVGIVISLALVIVQGVAVASLWFEPAKQSTGQDEAAPAEPATITQEGLFEVSSSNNVVVFVLDTFDVLNLNELLTMEPGVLDEMTGFTYFRNSAGFSAPTRWGLPFLLTDVWPDPKKSWDDFVQTRYPTSTFLDDLLAQNCALYIYTDTPGPGGTEYLSSRARNVHPLNEGGQSQGHSAINAHGAADILYKMALYRDMPWLFKGFFWFTTDAVNRAALNADAYENGSGGRDGINVPYIIDDAQYYDRLQKKRLSIHDDEGAASTLHLIHLYGAHYPYTLDEDAQRHGEYDGINEYQQSLGTLHIVDEYLSQMKELGVYDDATIVITADHGYWYWDDTIEQSEEDGDMAGGPIMLVKPSQTAEEASEPYETSDVPTGFVDFAATIIDATGGDSSKYGTTVYQVRDTNRTRYYYWPTHDGTDDLIIYEYAINGDVTDWDSWSRTGVSWDYYK